MGNLLIETETLAVQVGLNHIPTLLSFPHLPSEAGRRAPGRLSLLVTVGVYIIRYLLYSASECCRMLH